MSAALDAVKAYAEAKREYAEAYSRDLQDDLDLWDHLQVMADAGELSVTAEEAFNLFVDSDSKVTMVPEGSLLDFCWGELADNVQGTALALGIYVPEAE